MTVVDIKLFAVLYSISRFNKIWTQKCKVSRKILEWFKLDFRHRLTDVVNQNDIDNLHDLRRLWESVFDKIKINLNSNFL
jgi:hypothetical protein